MIISASRRTDIPAFYAEWFFNRIKAGYVCVRNPINRNQISKINLNPDAVDGVVFWTKNPKPMLDKLGFLNHYPFYFQFTLNPYDDDVEAHLPKKIKLFETFKRLSDICCPQKVIWRYDPVLVNRKYTLAYHVEKFNESANELKGYTEKVIFSYLDFYKKTAGNMELLKIKEISFDEKMLIAGAFAEIARENNMRIETCAESIDVSTYNIGRARCVDDRLIADIGGRAPFVNKDRNQRPECGCVESVDIGEYNSCPHGCSYCYANCSHAAALNNRKKHIAASVLLIGEIQKNETVSERKKAGNKNLQRELF